MSVGDRVGPSHTTQKPSGIGSLDAYSCPYITIFDISNTPNASSLLLICACVAIAVGVLWFYLKPGRFQARELSRQGSFTMPGTSLTVQDYKSFMIGRQSHTFSFPAPYVIVCGSHTLCKRQLCACLHTFPLCESSRIMVYTANV